MTGKSPINPEDDKRHIVTRTKKSLGEAGGGFPEKPAPSLAEKPKEENTDGE